MCAQRDSNTHAKANESGGSAGGCAPERAPEDEKMGLEWLNGVWLELPEMAKKTILETAKMMLLEKEKNST